MSSNLKLLIKRRRNKEQLTSDSIDHLVMYLVSSAFERIGLTAKKDNILSVAEFQTKDAFSRLFYRNTKT